ncbi:MAG TPA: hypothetical protein VGA36_01890, partial [Nitriliruptorales bacterium]
MNVDDVARSAAEAVRQEAARSVRPPLGRRAGQPPHVLLAMSAVLMLVLAVVVTVQRDDKPSIQITAPPPAASPREEPGGGESDEGFDPASPEPSDPEASDPGPGTASPSPTDGAEDPGDGGAGETTDAGETGEPTPTPTPSVSPTSLTGDAAPGVTDDEVRIVYYLDAHPSRRDEPSNVFYDLSERAAGGEPEVVGALRALTGHFAGRFDAHGRTVHAFAYLADHAQGGSPESRRADAAQIVDLVDPFAVVTSGILRGDGEAFVSEVAASGRVVIGSHVPLRQALRDRWPGQVWSFGPSLEEHAAMYAGYACSRVVGHPVATGVAEGQPRVLGLVRAADDERPDLVAYAEEVRERIRACGGEFVAEATFSQSGQAVNADLATSSQTNMARFQASGVTTVLWAAGYDTSNSRAAAQVGYEPEWVVAGQGLHDSVAHARLQDQTIWEHAAVVAAGRRVAGPDADPCRVATGDAGRGCGQPFFEDAGLVLAGVAGAGRDLTTGTFAGALERVRGSDLDPSLPDCRFAAGRTSCVGDATVQWWDPTATNPDSAQPGCWRLIDAGRRASADGWGATAHL